MNIIKIMAADFGLVRDDKWCLTEGHMIGLAIGAVSWIGGIAWAIMCGGNP